MPLAQVSCAVVEKGLNTLLNMDSKNHETISKFAGKSLRVTVAELPAPFVFQFNEQISVLSHKEEVDCDISLSMSTLGELQDTSQITALLKNDKLTLEGDLHLAQGFAAMLQNLDIDWEEQLSQWIGDVAAHTTIQAFKRLSSHAEHTFVSLRGLLRDSIVDEKPIAIDRSQFNQHSQQVDELRSATARLEARINQLSEVAE